MIATIETVNYCNGHCTCCPCKNMSMQKRIMTLDEFKKIADRLKELKIQIGAMYANGEPFLDSTILEKFEYAKEIGILRYNCGLNTNGHLLSESQFKKLCDVTNGITFSCFNTWSEYEEITGLPFNKFDELVRKFVDFKNKHMKDFLVSIGVNSVEGSSLINVINHFKDLNIIFVEDQGIDWHNMKNVMKCDFEDNVIVIKSNGDFTTCCLDYNGENCYGSIFSDFKPVKGKLCLRCDYGKEDKDGKAT